MTGKQTGGITDSPVFAGFDAWRLNSKISDLPRCGCRGTPQWEFFRRCIVLVKSDEFLQRLVHFIESAMLNVAVLIC